MERVINFTRFYHNGISKKKCPHGEQVAIDGKLYTRFVGECDECKYFVKDKSYTSVICNKESEVKE